MEIKKEKVTIGLVLAGVGLLASQIINRKKLGVLIKRLNNTEDTLEDLKDKSWSLNRSIKEMAKAHNSMINLRIDDYEDFEDRFYEIEDEIAIIYGHLEELSEFKKYKNGEDIKARRNNGTEEVEDTKNGEI